LQPYCARTVILVPFTTIAHSSFSVEWENSALSQITKHAVSSVLTHVLS